MLKDIPALASLRERMSVSDAAAAGVTVLRKGRVGASVALGALPLPLLPSGNRFDLVPEGFYMFERPTSFVLHPQQVHYACRFLELLRQPDTGAVSRGMRLSGSRGTGKSATAILAWLAAQAQQHLTVYVRHSRDWLIKANHGRGDAFLLDELFDQNADLIAADRDLAAIFKPLREHDAHGFRVGDASCKRAETAFEALHVLQRHRGDMRMGLIVERMHEVETAVTALKLRQDGVDDTGARYFASGGWLDWSGHNSRLFARLDTARSFGALEPDTLSATRTPLHGYVQPWSAADARTFTRHTDSPGYVKTLKLLNETIPVVGTAPRTLMQIRWTHHRLTTMPQHTRYSSVLGAFRMDMEHARFDATVKNITDPAERRALGRQFLPLLQGRAHWRDVQPLYERGLVTRVGGESCFVTPISPLAFHYAHCSLGSLAAEAGDSISTLPGVAGDTQLRDQVYACFSSSPPVYGGVCKHMRDCTAADDANRLRWTCGRVAPMPTLADTATGASAVRGWESIMERDSVVFIPTSGDSLIHAVRVPSERCFGHGWKDKKRSKLPIQVLHISTAHPWDSTRVAAITSWFDDGGVIDQLKAVHGTAKPTAVMLAWNGTFDAASCAAHSVPAALLERAAAVGVRLLVADAAALAPVGVKV